MPLTLDRNTGIVAILITLDEIETLPSLQKNSRHRNAVNQIGQGHSRPTAFPGGNYFANSFNANPSVGIELLGDSKSKANTGIIAGILNTVAISQDVDC